MSYYVRHLEQCLERGKWTIKIHWVCYNDHDDIFSYASEQNSIFEVSSWRGHETLCPNRPWAFHSPGWKPLRESCLPLTQVSLSEPPRCLDPCPCTEWVKTKSTSWWTWFGPFIGKMNSRHSGAPLRQICSKSQRSLFSLWRTKLPNSCSSQSRLLNLQESPELLLNVTLLKIRLQTGGVVHACNPNSLEDWGGRIACWSPAQAT